MSYVDHSAAVPGRGQCGGHEGHEWVEVDRLRDTLRITNEVANSEIARLRAELALLQRHDDLAMTAANEARAAISRVRELVRRDEQQEADCACDYAWRVAVIRALEVLE